MTNMRIFNAENAWEEACNILQGCSREKARKSRRKLTLAYRRLSQWAQSPLSDRRERRVLGAAVPIMACFLRMFHIRQDPLQQATRHLHLNSRYDLLPIPCSIRYPPDVKKVDVLFWLRFVLTVFLKYRFQLLFLYLLVVR